LELNHHGGTISKPHFQQLERALPSLSKKLNFSQHIPSKGGNYSYSRQSLEYIAQDPVKKVLTLLISYQLDIKMLL